MSMPDASCAQCGVLSYTPTTLYGVGPSTVLRVRGCLYSCTVAPVYTVRMVTVHFSSLENEDCDVTVASSIFAIEAVYLCDVTAGDMSMPLNMA